MTCLRADRLYHTSTSVWNAGSKENKSEFENPLLRRPRIGIRLKAELSPIPRSRTHFAICDRDPNDCRLSPHLSLTPSESLSFSSYFQAYFRNLQHRTRSPVIQDRPIGCGTRGTASSGPGDSVGAARAASSNVPRIAMKEPKCRVVT